ncbi:hypothetical protein BASA61_004454 [Batrachochytrium salamandrivorans]|nr:hypothetical protein BASA61_004454 [Batrachochytrium salamandrivorans]
MLASVTKPSVESPIPDRWSRFPTELQQYIVTLAGPLTLFLHYGLDPCIALSAASPLLLSSSNHAGIPSLVWSTACSSDSHASAAAEASRLIWLDVFKLNWLGDLSCLPSYRPHIKDLQLVHNRSMYYALRRHFLPALSSPSPSSTLVSEAMHPTLPLVSSVQSMCGILMHIPMQNLWLDEFDADSLQLHIHHAVSDAIQFGYLEFLKHLVSSYMITIDTLCVRVLPMGLYPEGTLSLALSNSTCTTAYEQMSGDHDGSDFDESSWTYNVIDIVASNNDLNMVKWLVEHGSTGCSTEAIDKASEHGHLEMVTYLHNCYTGSLSHDTPSFATTVSGDSSIVLGRPVGGCTQWAMIAAAKNGHLDIVKFLHANRTEGCTSKAMDCAARHGHLEVVQFLHTHRSEGCTSVAMDSAAAYGHFDIIQWLHLNRTEGCTWAAMDSAAASGYLEIVQFLHSSRTEGCTVAAMDTAAREGHLHVVQWLHANRPEGCTVNAMNRAASNGHLHIVKYLHTERQEGCTVLAMDTAAARGHLEVVEWLHFNRKEGCTSNAMDAAATNGHLNIVQFLHTHRTEGCTVKAMDAAAREGHLSIIQWLHANRHEGCTEWAATYAALNGSLAITAWLLENRQEGYSLHALSTQNDAVAEYLVLHMTNERRHELLLEAKTRNCEKIIISRLSVCI